MRQKAKNGTVGYVTANPNPILGTNKEVEIMKIRE